MNRSSSKCAVRGIPSVSGVSRPSAAPVEGLNCKRPIQCLASSKILTPQYPQLAWWLNVKFIWWKLKMSYNTAFPIQIDQLLFAICFSIPTYVHHQLHSFDCQKFGHHNSLVIFTYLGTSPGAGFHFGKRTYNFQIV